MDGWNQHADARSVLPNGILHGKDLDVPQFSIEEFGDSTNERGRPIPSEDQSHSPLRQLAVDQGPVRFDIEVLVAVTQGAPHLGIGTSTASRIEVAPNRLAPIH